MAPMAECFQPPSTIVSSGAHTLQDRRPPLELRAGGSPLLACPKTVDSCHARMANVGEVVPRLRRPLSLRAVKACRSIAQALEHERNGGATGTQVGDDHQERALSQSQPRQATFAAGVSVSPCIASHGSTRVCVEMALEVALPNAYSTGAWACSTG